MKCVLGVSLEYEHWGVRYLERDPQLRVKKFSMICSYPIWFEIIEPVHPLRFEWRELHTAKANEFSWAVEFIARYLAQS